MKKMLKLLILIISISILMLLVMTTSVRAESESFSLSETNVTISLNSHKYLYYSNANGASVVWTSSDSDVATVDNSGTVTAVGIGTVTITATAGEQRATCQITVVYNGIEIRTNEDEYVSTVNLVMREHPNQTLKAKVTDLQLEEVINPAVTWKSSDTSVVTVDNSGKISAVSTGTVTITAEAAGVSDTCEVKVFAAPEFTDFSNAKYELLFDIDTDLKISGITPKDDEKNRYYYIITSSSTKPTIPIDESGSIDLYSDSIEYLIVNTEENYIYDRDIDKFVELNQELYIWVIQEVRLEESYNNGQNNVSYSTKFVAEGQKLTRPELPQLNLIVKSFDIGSWKSDSDSYENTNIRFRFPSAVENRKFTIKIGRVTDNAILKKIQENDYSGITELLTYAKNTEAVYSSSLTATSENYYRSEQVLFDGSKLLIDDAYYYIYVVFDDEDGKYYPIEGVTLGQAYLSDESEYWDLWAYTSEEFKWNDLSSSYNEPDTTVAPKEIPKAGITTIVITVLMVLIVSLVISTHKYNKFRGI